MPVVALDDACCVQDIPHGPSALQGDLKMLFSITKILCSCNRYFLRVSLEAQLKSTGRWDFVLAIFFILVGIVADVCGYLGGGQRRYFGSDQTRLALLIRFWFLAWCASFLCIDSTIVCEPATIIPPWVEHHLICRLFAPRVSQTAGRG